MSHEIRIPHRDRSDPLSSVGELARHLESPDESATVRELVTDAAGAGLTTVGDLLDRLGRLAPAERRALLDRARSSAGLPTATEVAAKASHAEQDRLLSVAAADEVSLQLVPSANGWRDPGRRGAGGRAGTRRARAPRGPAGALARRTRR
jgi:hypothetical protein